MKKSVVIGGIAVAGIAALTAFNTASNYEDVNNILTSNPLFKQGYNTSTSVRVGTKGLNFEKTVGNKAISVSSMFFAAEVSGRIEYKSLAGLDCYVERFERLGPLGIEYMQGFKQDCELPEEINQILRAPKP